MFILRLLGTVTNSSVKVRRSRENRSTTRTLRDILSFHTNIRTGKAGQEGRVTECWGIGKVQQFLFSEHSP